MATKPTHHIIYIPGLGDNYDDTRRKALRLWRIYGVTTELVPMQWYDRRPYEEKVRAIDDAITAAFSRGQQISLVGESAGASIALNVFAHDQRIFHLVTVCGVVDADASVSPTLYARSPAFKTSMSLLADSLAQLGEREQDIRTITSLYDPVVNQKRNIITNVHPTRIWVTGHMTAIVLCLSVLAVMVVRRAVR
jgi:pimeloyl-ACP methyl ester carboxylesterase